MVVVLHSVAYFHLGLAIQNPYVIKLAVDQAFLDFCLLLLALCYDSLE